MDVAVALNPAIILTLKELVVENVAAISFADQVDDQSDLASLGMDSMSALNLLLDIEEEFDVAFPEEYLTAEVFRTPASLAMAIQELATT